MRRWKHVTSNRKTGEDRGRARLKSQTVEPFLVLQPINDHRILADADLWPVSFPTLHWTKEVTKSE